MSLSQRYYNPYADIVDLRRAPLGAAMRSQYDDPMSMKSLYAAARDLGVKLPPPPSGMNANENLAWRILAAVDVVSLRLSMTYQYHLRALATYGMSVCEDLQRYNLSALRLHDVQRGVMRALAKAGVEGLQGVPMPPLFIGTKEFFASEDDGLISCSTSRYVSAVSSDQQSGVRALLDPCPQGTLNAAWIAPAAQVARLGLLTVISFIGYKVIDRVLGSFDDTKAMEKTVEAAAIESEYNLLRAKLIDTMAERCREKLPAGYTADDSRQCFVDADKAVPKDLKSMLALFEITKGRGFVWYLGAAVIAIAIGGTIFGVWRWKRRRSEED